MTANPDKRTIRHVVRRVIVSAAITLVAPICYLVFNAIYEAVLDGRHSHYLALATIIGLAVVVNIWYASVSNAEITERLSLLLLQHVHTRIKMDEAVEEFRKYYD